MNVHGTCDSRFDDLREIFTDNIASGEECGAALAIDVDGDLVVDLWGGHRDAARTLPWERDTIVNVWSTTKEVTALAVLLLADRGLLDLDAPVATYWPEFAAAGKEAVTVTHLMSHTSGVAGWDQPIVTSDLYDWDLSTSRLAGQAPWWEPGTASGYHLINYGHLLGEVVRRVTGKHLKTFVADEIAGPLGTDLQIGAGPADDHRIAELIPPPPLTEIPPMSPDAPAFKAFTGPAVVAEDANTVPWRRADIGGANGHSTARALARTLSVIARGSVGDPASGTGLTLSPATIGRIFEEQSHGVDLVLGVPLRFGIGFALPETTSVPYIPDGRICYWGGYGGSQTVMVPEAKTTISYVMNKMGGELLGSAQTSAYLTAAFAALNA
ncbi:MAG: class A beta-lactamase-related serine hydrolase [Gordonia sp. (in: high G+C Gram-positive bacteria)]|nr:MAG: class A beta-lactamase-related serine hydrolase [Gordonia sp. (in: high G+C Gram-positive bacteria)]